MMPIFQVPGAPLDYTTVLLAVAGGSLAFVLAYYLRTIKAATDEPELGEYEIFLVGQGKRFQGLLSYAEKLVKGWLESPALVKHLEGHASQEEREALTKLIKSHHFYAMRGSPRNFLIISPVQLEDSKHNDLVSRVLRWFPPGYETHHRVFAQPASMDLGVGANGWHSLYVIPQDVTEIPDIPDMRLVADVALSIKKAAESQEETMAARATAEKWKEAFEQASRAQADLAAKFGKFVNAVSTHNPDQPGTPQELFNPPSLGLVIGVVLIGLVIGLFVMPGLFKNPAPTSSDLAGYGIMGVLITVAFAKWRKVI